MADKFKVDIHADDYGYSLNTSKDIIECVKNEALDSFSIMSNMPDFDKNMELLYKKVPSFSYLPLLSVHINLVEGYGYDNSLLNRYSWGSYFLGSYSFRRNKLKEEIKKNIKYQIDKADIVINKCIQIAKNNNIPVKQKYLRLDSHVHTHLIPVVWDALTEVIKENSYQIEYIRNPKEPIIPFIKSKVFGSCEFINKIKNRILMLYSRKVDRYCDSHNLNKEYMCGLMCSGKMDYDRVSKVYPELCNKSQNDGRQLELLFHPGRALENEYNESYIKDAYKTFNSSDNRRIEKEAVLKMKGNRNGY